MVFVRRHAVDFVGVRMSELRREAARRRVHEVEGRREAMTGEHHVAYRC